MVQKLLTWVVLNWWEELLAMEVLPHQQFPVLRCSCHRKWHVEKSRVLQLIYGLLDAQSLKWLPEVPHGRRLLIRYQLFIGLVFPVRRQRFQGGCQVKLKTFWARVWGGIQGKGGQLKSFLSIHLLQNWILLLWKLRTSLRVLQLVYWNRVFGIQWKCWNVLGMYPMKVFCPILQLKGSRGWLEGLFHQFRVSPIGLGMKIGSQWEAIA